MDNQLVTTKTMAAATVSGSTDQVNFREWFIRRWMQTYDALGVPTDRRIKPDAEGIRMLSDLADRVAQRMRGFTPATLREVLDIGIQRYVTDGGSASFPTFTEPVLWAWIEKYRNEADARLLSLAPPKPVEPANAPEVVQPTDEELIAALRAVSGPFEKIALEMGFSTPIYDDLFRRMLDQHGGIEARKRCGRLALERWVNQVSAQFNVKPDRIWSYTGPDAVTLTQDADREIRRWLGGRTEGELMMPSFRTLFRHQVFSHLRKSNAFADFDPESGDTPYALPESPDVDNM